MPIIYKFDVLQALKEKGYNTGKLRKEKLLAEGVIQSLREKKAISFSNLEKLCELLSCQPGDIIAYSFDDKESTI
ncbi:MAG: helix-turn-helix domain-containing protein [Hominimerdicola sp.]